MNKVNHQKQPLNAHPKETSPLSVSRPWIFRTLLNYCLGSYDVKNDYPKPSKALARIFTYIMPGMFMDVGPLENRLCVVLLQLLPSYLRKSRNKNPLSPLLSFLQNNVLSSCGQENSLHKVTCSRWLYLCFCLPPDSTQICLLQKLETIDGKRQGNWLEYQLLEEAIL